MDDPILEVKGICKSFDENVVLSGVDFSLRAGEVHAIVGQNGAGKSTLMKILSGVYQRDSGQIRINGAPVSYRSQAEAATKGVSMVFQDFSLVPTMKVYQNIFLSWINSGRKGLFLRERELKARARELLDFIGVEIPIGVEDKVEDISIGSRQIVEIAKALSTDSRILIFDEPTASLSMAETALLFKTIDSLKAKGVAIIYITHYLRDVFKICDSLTVLRDGKVVLASPVPDTSLEKVIQAMTGKSNQTRSAGPRMAGSGGEEALRLESLCTAKIRNISFSLRKGEIIGLAGLLGSGRTEILRALYGLDHASSGAVFVGGRKVSLRSTRAAKTAGIALVPEDRRVQGLVTQFTLYQNIVLGILPEVTRRLWLDARRGRGAAESYVQRFGIKTKGIHEEVRLLSGGNQQKVVIAKNIAARPGVLLLDDPTFGIDVQSKAEIMDIVRGYVAEGNAAILVSSEFTELIGLCDRILLVKKGEIAGEIRVDPERTTEEEILRLAQ